MGKKIEDKSFIEIMYPIIVIIIWLMLIVLGMFMNLKDIEGGMFLIGFSIIQLGFNISNQLGKME